jgi:hypothetical protein
MRSPSESDAKSKAYITLPKRNIYRALFLMRNAFLVGSGASM